MPLSSSGDGGGSDDDDGDDDDGCFFIGCLSAQAGSRFSTYPISNFWYTLMRKVLSHFTYVDIQIQKAEVACPRTEPKWNCVRSQWVSLFTALGSQANAHLLRNHGIPT